MIKHDYPRILHEQLHGRYKGQDENERNYDKKSTLWEWIVMWWRDPPWTDWVERRQWRRLYGNWEERQGVAKPLTLWQRIVKWWKHEIDWARWL